MFTCNFRGELADRQQVLGKFLSRLTKLAEEFNVSALITNQVVSDPGYSHAVRKLIIIIVWVSR